MLKAYKCLMVFALLTLSASQGQTAQEPPDDTNSYFGLGADVFVAGDGLIVPAPSFQFGTEVAPHFEIRGSLTTLIFVSVLSVDALYVASLPEPTLRFYLGGGPDMALVIPIFSPDLPPLIPFIAVHATAGLEYRHNELIGLYAEGQPFLIFGGDLTPGVRLRSGVNFHF